MPDCSERADSREPAVQALPHEAVVRQLRVCRDDPIDLGHLSGAELLVGVQAPAACQQPLAPQYLVDPGDTASKVVRSVEDRAIGVSDARARCQQPECFAVRARVITADCAAAVQELDGAAGPVRPLPKETAGE